MSGDNLRRCKGFASFKVLGLSCVHDTVDGARSECMHVLVAVECERTLLSCSGK